MDYVIIGGIILFALIGLWKGAAKLFFGLFMLLIIMVGAAFAASAISPLILTKTTDEGVEFTPAATVLMDPIGGIIPDSDEMGELLNKKIEDRDGVLYFEDSDVALTNAIAEYIPEVGSYLAPIVAAVAIPGMTLKVAVAYTLTRYVYEIAIWVVLVIILAIIRNIIRKKIFRYLDREDNAAKSKLDRVLGIVLNIAILLIIFWGVGALVARFDDGANWAHDADAFFLNGTIAEPLMANNPLLKLINVTLPVASESVS